MDDPANPVSLSEEQCSRIAARASLPDPVAVTRIPRGEVNTCFDLTLRNGEHVVLKLKTRGQSPDALQKEREIYDLLQRHRIPVPRVLDVNTERDILPWDYSVQTMLPGHDADTVFQHLSPDAQLDLFHDLGRMLARIHAVPWTGLTSMNPPASSDEWSDRARQRFSAAFDAHKKAGFLPSRLLAAVHDHWTGFEWYLWFPRPLCLLHGDFQLCNIKLSMRMPNTIALFDVEQAEVGDPEYDFAALETGILSIRDDLREAFYDGYQYDDYIEGRYGGRTELYVLLRHLEMMLAYQGPVRFPDGTGSAAQTIARMVSVHLGRSQVPGLWGLPRLPAIGIPGRRFGNPKSEGAITSRYLASVLANGLDASVVLAYWHRFDSPNWQGFDGRSGARLVFLQAAVQVNDRPMTDLGIVLKITPSLREARFFQTLAPLLKPYVPAPYHIAIRSKDNPHWIFLEHIPCMSLGPLWAGREFTKALEGLVTVQSRFWERRDLIGNRSWLPVVTPKVLIDNFHANIESIRNAPTCRDIPRALRRRLANLCDAAARRPDRVRELAHCLASQPLTLVHGDCHLANIGTRDMSPDSPPVIADWSACMAGPPQIDLCNLLDAIRGILRDKPDREHLIDQYLTMLNASGISAFESTDRGGHTPPVLGPQEQNPPALGSHKQDPPALGSHKQDPPALSLSNGRYHVPYFDKLSTGGWSESDTFQTALTAAALFADAHTLNSFVHNWQWESSWRADIFHPIEEDTTLRIERTLTTLGW